ncbi:MAG: OsmC family protein [Alphaproteobacteria bacterium]|nr:OsmC family protein [Alphaproteobacteria bacterium]
MDATELRAIQAPIKQGYKENPETAIVPAHAEARLGANITVEVPGWGGQNITAGIHKAAGGTGQAACSADMLLEALVACAGVTLSSVATAMGITLGPNTVVKADGEWDARGTLGVSKEVPVGMTKISLSFDLDTDADEKTKEKLIQLTERFCVIYQTLKNPPRMGLG